MTYKQVVSEAKHVYDYLWDFEARDDIGPTLRQVIGRKLDKLKRRLTVMPVPYPLPDPA
jgi:hypothetical protein